MYRALVERDPSFRGVFFVGVKTTGIVCRVGCPAKAPRPENCEFFASPKEALYAGYRPCLRCRPMDRAPEPSPIVARLRQLVESNPGIRLTDARLRELGVEPTTARRQFLRHCGMTFHAYQRARRMGMALADLREHKDVPRAMDVAGYESWSGFGEAFTGIFGKSPGAAGEVEHLVADWFETPLGPMVAVASGAGLCVLEFCDRRALEREMELVRRRWNAVIVPGRNASIVQVRRELEEYFAGSRTRFDVPLVMRGSDFQVRVWRALIEIPCGQTRSYGQIAAATGTAGAVRAVGRANGDNRIAIIIPCHRVIRSDGSMCGYGGGIWRKHRLLEHEATMAGVTGPGRQLMLAV
jgi:AraC family transcriptional regulator of adaptative response/methylated-DNA-[protein]-cysteine methyltransferase